MLTVPEFRSWRPIWDVELGSATLRLDELAAQRQRGRASPPALTPEVIRRVTFEPIKSLIHGERELPAGEAFAVLQQLRPLVEAAVWPRWLLLEDALEEASASGDLHLAALVLRTQIEELDALLDVARLLTLPPQSVGEGKLLATGIEVLRKRVLPRVRTKSAEELLEPAGEAPGAGRRSERLQKAFDALGDYVHPNYGSHVLAVRPHSAEAAKILVDAFVTVYETFQSLPWPRESEDRPPPSAAREGKSPFLVLAEDTAPVLAQALGAVIVSPPWPDAITCFGQQVEIEDSQNAMGRSVESGEISQQDLKLEVGAIRALRQRGVPPDPWPVPISTAAERLRYALLVEDERRLVEDAERLGSASAKRDEESWLQLLCSALTFSIHVVEFKLDTLARQAARLLNAENVLGVALVVRSMLEHHAVAVELGKKLTIIWERIERAAPTDERVAAVLGDAEKQVARVLAGNPESQEKSAAWRGLWESTVRKYHVLEPVKAMDTDQPGYLKTYGLLSHSVHGTVCTGGDLLEGRGIRPARHTLAQLALFLAKLCTLESMLDLQAGSVLVAHRLAVIQRDPAVGLGPRIARMRLLQGQKLKPGRDVYGSGTEEDPFRFRHGLLYHDAYYYWLTQEGVQVRNRRVHMFEHRIGDRIETEDSRVLYFVNEDLPSK